MMISPTTWTPFETEQDALAFLKRNGVITAKSASVKTLCYHGEYSDAVEVCRVVGCASPFTAVIELPGGLHCINADCLKEMQDGMSKWLKEIEELSGLKAYVVLDFETTGLSAATDEVIEIAAVKYINGREADVLSTLVNPQFRLPHVITELTGITDADLMDAPIMGAIAPQLRDFLGRDAIVAHNASFERQFLSAIYSRYGYELENVFIDTVRLARSKFPKLKNHKLQTLISHCDICVDAAHRALPDTRATAELFKICVYCGA